MLFVTAIMTGSVLISYLIFHKVIKETYTEQFIDEIKKSEYVLLNYLDSRYTLLKSGIDIMLSDPRFLASIAEGDPETAQNEISDFRNLVQADFLVITDTSGSVLATGGQINLIDLGIKDLRPSKFQRGYQESYRFQGTSAYQVLSTPIHFHSLYSIGKLFAGFSLDKPLMNKFRHLTGSDISLLIDDKMINQKSENFASVFFDLSSKQEISGNVYKATFSGEEYLILKHELQESPMLSLALYKSLDEQLEPAMSRITKYLVLLNALVLLISVITVYRFTSQHLTKTVNNLVSAADNIANEKLNDPILPVHNDELGILATRFNEMRLTLLKNRERLAKNQEERIQSERLSAIGKISAGIIHDFKSPMTVITMAVDTISQGVLSEDQVIDYCQKISDQVDRMVNMTKDILDFAHGQKSLNLNEVELISNLRDKIEYHREKFENKNIQLVCRYCDPLYISIDTHKIRRVIDNILTNAYEALSPGERVTIEVSQRDELIEIKISDNGPGIPESLLENIFQPFFTHGKSGGTGLGLAISQKIVEDHGGRLEVSSGEGIGTSFSLELPFSPMKNHLAEDALQPEEVNVQNQI